MNSLVHTTPTNYQVIIIANNRSLRYFRSESMSEWLRRSIRNRLGSSRAGSSPVTLDEFSFWFAILSPDGRCHWHGIGIDIDMNYE